MAHPPLPITSCDSSSDLSRLLLGKCSIWKGASRQVALSNGVGSLVSQSKNQRFDKFMKREKAKTMTYHKSQFNLHPGYISDIYENWRLWWCCWWWWLWWFVLSWIVNGLVVLCATVGQSNLANWPPTILNLELGHRLTLLPDDQDDEDDEDDYDEHILRRSQSTISWPLLSLCFNLSKCFHLLPLPPKNYSILKYFRKNDSFLPSAGWKGKSA